MWSIRRDQFIVVHISVKRRVRTVTLEWGVVRTDDFFLVCGRCRGVHGRAIRDPQRRGQTRSRFLFFITPTPSTFPPQPCDVTHLQWSLIINNHGHFFMYSGPFVLCNKKNQRRSLSFITPTPLTSSLLSPRFFRSNKDQGKSMDT
jgi:hypothetical protein